MERIPDLQFEFHDFDDGSFVRLEQSAGCGETAIVDLHVSQLRLLAERAGLLADGNDSVAERRLRTVAKKLFDLANADYYRSEIIERCGMGSEFMTELDGVRDLADEFLRDLENTAAARVGRNANSRLMSDQRMGPYMTGPIFGIDAAELLLMRIRHLHSRIVGNHLAADASGDYFAMISAEGLRMESESLVRYAEELVGYAMLEERTARGGTLAEH